MGNPGLITKQIKKEIGYAIDKRLKEEQQKAAIDLESKFMNNISEFVSVFAIIPNKTPAFFNISILDKLDSGKVESRILSLEPEDVMQIYNFINYRYLLTDCQYYVKELSFLEAISNGIEKIDLEKPLLSNNIISRFLKPVLNKAIKSLSLYKAK